MRIVQFVANLDTGGLERLVVDLARCQRLEGHEAIIYCLNQPGRLAAEATDDGVIVRWFAKPPGFHLPTLWKIARQMRRDHPDVLHTHNHMVHHYGVVAALLAKVPVIVNTRHGVDRRILSNSDRSEIGIDSPDRKADLIYRATLPWVDSVVLISEATRRFYIQYRGIPATKTRVILNGAHLEKFSAVPAHPGSNPTRIRFGIAARLVAEKDLFTLLRAFSMVFTAVPHAELHIAGSGHMQRDLVTFAHDLKLDRRVRFLGEISDIPAFLSELDVFVLSSLTEGLPVCVLEAMAAGLPIVATRAGGIEEAAVHGRNAYLVDPADAVALAQAMIRIGTERRLAEFGNVSRDLVQNRFRIERTWQQYRELYQERGAPCALSPSHVENSDHTVHHHYEAHGYSRRDS
jgi:glycosyltransferase involved in cell wall biosynthesis